MELTIDISKKYSISLIGILIILFGTFILNAVPNPGHLSEKILIKIPGGPYMGEQWPLENLINQDNNYASQPTQVLSRLPLEFKAHTPYCYRNCGSTSPDVATTQSATDSYTCNDDQKSHSLNPPSSVYGCFLQAIVIAPNNNNNKNSIAGIKYDSNTNTWTAHAQNTEYIISCLSNEGPWNSANLNQWLDCKLN